MPKPEEKRRKNPFFSSVRKTQIKLLCDFFLPEAKKIFNSNSTRPFSHVYPLGAVTSLLHNLNVFHMMHYMNISKNSLDNEIYTHALTHTQTDTARQTQRHRLTQTNTDRHRQTQTDTDRQTQSDRHRQTQIGTDRHRQTQTDKDRHRRTQTDR